MRSAKAATGKTGRTVSGKRSQGAAGKRFPSERDSKTFPRRLCVCSSIGTQARASLPRRSRLRSGWPASGVDDGAIRQRPLGPSGPRRHHASSRVHHRRSGRRWGTDLGSPHGSAARPARAGPPGAGALHALWRGACVAQVPPREAGVPVRRAPRIPKDFRAPFSTRMAVAVPL